ncbi:oxytocin-neurophysin 1-like [Sitophilus oryzae]|uniref:Oxytocin-neurophysin 1-like n=1 Tax=Sitophilus oryzae TaxID=7048 RepID=A0A6J2YJ36_SITOR|nr:oxytocin-neurophysin 1-like [Sitophilus oryzae]
MGSQKNSSTSSFLKTLYRFMFIMFLGDILASGCLITNCPRGGKRSGKFALLEKSNIKQCIACGPGGTGQCFGPSICCGPFGCLMGTPETIKCHRDGFFHEKDPCIAGSANCRKNTGRCTMDGICCSQDACHIDKQCSLDEKKVLAENISPIELMNMLGYTGDNVFEK